MDLYVVLPIVLSALSLCLSIWVWYLTYRPKISFYLEPAVNFTGTHVFVTICNNSDTPCRIVDAYTEPKSNIECYPVPYNQNFNLYEDYNFLSSFKGNMLNPHEKIQTLIDFKGNDMKQIFTVFIYYKYGMEIRKHVVKSRFRFQDTVIHYIGQENSDLTKLVKRLIQQ